MSAVFLPLSRNLMSTEENYVPCGCGVAKLLRQALVKSRHNSEAIVVFV